MTNSSVLAFVLFGIASDSPPLDSSPIGDPFQNDPFAKQSSLPAAAGIYLFTTHEFNYTWTSQEFGGTLIGEEGLVVMTGAE